MTVKFKYVIVNELLNSMGEVIARKEEKTFSEIRDEFQEAYLK